MGVFFCPDFHFVIFPFAADEPLTLLLRWAFCQDRNMKQLCVSCLFPMLLTAQTAQLTEQLGKTVLYEDIALSPDGAHVAWVQSTAATTSKQTFVRGTTGSEPATMVNIPSASERTDSGPAWSPDSKTLAFFSTAGRKRSGATLDSEMLMVLILKNLPISRDTQRALVGRMMVSRLPFSI